MEKTVKTKIVFKHELEVNWLKSSYVPLNGEQVIYDAEIDANGNTLELPSGRSAPYSYPRVKIGDGVRTVNQLPFPTVSADEVLNIVIPKSKNLFNVEAIKESPWIDNNVSISDGSLWLYNGSGGFYTDLTLSDVCPDLKVGKTYTINYTWVQDYDCSGASIGVSYSKGYLYLDGTFTVTEELLNGTLEFTAGDGFEYDEEGNSYPYPGAGTFTHIMLNEGTEALPYEPYANYSYAQGTIGALLTGIEDMVKKYVNEAILGGEW
jgi:hypothetical protein